MDRQRRDLLFLSAASLGLATVGYPWRAGAGSLLLPAGVVNVRQYGAKGDGATIDSPAINRAVDDVAARGGGTVFFPAGTYASYTVRLKSNVSLYLDQGAVLLAASTPREGLASGGYDAAEFQDPAIDAFQDYGHNHWKNSLIYGEGLHDIAILGEGRIWGKGLSRGHDFDTDLPLTNRPGVGNKAIALKNCHNVQLRDFQILQGGWFAVLATAVDNLTIDNLIVDTNRDGFDIDCCRNVRVTNCIVNSPWDDGICPKSSFALGYARSTENVTIANCTVSGSYVVGAVLDGSFKRLSPDQQPYATGRIKCGTESNGGFKNITITNCTFDHSRGIALETVDGANLEDITISNITMRGSCNSPLFLRLGRRMRGPKGTQVGTLKRILINNITSSSSVPLPSIIAGVDGHPVEDVQISDLYLEQVGGVSQLPGVVPPNEDQYPEPTMFGALPATGFFIRQARNVEMHHIEVACQARDARPAFWMEDVDGFDGFALRTPSVPAFNLTRVSEFRLAACRQFADKLYTSPASATF